MGKKRVRPSRKARPDSRARAHPTSKPSPHASPHSSAKPFHSYSLDLLRALAILLFLFYHVLVTFVSSADLPALLRYNGGTGLQFGDLIAPTFSFVLGAALAFSYQNAKHKGWPFFWRKILSFGGLIALGLVLDGLFCGSLFGFCLKWGVLQWLGAGGLLALLFLRLERPALLLAAFLLLLALYSQRMLLLAPLASVWYGASYALTTSLEFGLISVFGLLAARLRRSPLVLAALSLLLLVAALVLSSQIPLDKAANSLTYAMAGAALPALFWLALGSFDAGLPAALRFVSAHSLLLWTLQYVLMWYPLGFLNLWGHQELGLGAGLLLSLAGVPFFVLAACGWKTRLEPRLHYFLSRLTGRH